MSYVISWKVFILGETIQFLSTYNSTIITIFIFAFTNRVALFSIDAFTYGPLYRYILVNNVKSIIYLH